MAYDPKAETGIPTETVGSLPRPAKLQAAYAEYDAGNISKEQLEAEQDEAVMDSITRLEATGSPIVSDGEQRWSSFATYPLADTLAGTGLAPNLAPAGQYFAITCEHFAIACEQVTRNPRHSRRLSPLRPRAGRDGRTRRRFPRGTMRPSTSLYRRTRCTRGNRS